MRRSFKLFRPHSLVLAPEVPKALAEDTANPETSRTNTS